MSSDEELKSKKKKSKKNKKDKKEKSAESEEVKQEEIVENEVEETVEKPKKRKHKKDKNRHEDEDVVEEKVSKKEDDIPEVHTANNWEEADLGDQERKKKFLKLMGATKHKDEDVHEEGHKHFRTRTEVEKMNTDLEKQFTESLTSKIQHKNHCGLGFEDESKPADNYYKSYNNSRFANTSSNNSNNKQADNDKLAKYKKMSFVKSNDS